MAITSRNDRFRLPFCHNKLEINGPLISPKISFFDPHGQKLGKIVNFDTSGMTHNDVIIFEKNRIEEKSQNKYLEKEF